MRGMINVDNILSALLEAIATRNVNGIKNLINQGANLNLPNNQGIYPLTIAFNRTDYEMNTTLGLAVNENIKNSHNEVISIRKMLIELGADPNITLPSKKTPLMEATIYNDIDMVKFLVSHHANLNMQDNEGNTALMYASTLDMAKLLAVSGINVEIKNRYGNTAYELAMSKKKLDIAEFLSLSSDNIVNYNIQISPSYRETLSNILDTLLNKMVWPFKEYGVEKEQDSYKKLYNELLLIQKSLVINDLSEDIPDVIIKESSFYFIIKLLDTLLRKYERMKRLGEIVPEVEMYNIKMILGSFVRAMKHSQKEYEAMLTDIQKEMLFKFESINTAAPIEKKEEPSSPFENFINLLIPKDKKD